MTIISGTERRSRAALLHVAAITWAVLISAAVIVNHVSLSGLTEQSNASAPSVQVAALENRVAELGQQVEQLQQQQPAALPQTRFEAERQAQGKRLASIEQALGERLTAESLDPLRTRIEQLEAQREKPRQAAPTPTRTRKTPPAKPKAAELPFKVIGPELRGGETFIAILPADSATPSSTRVLHPGETESGWRLETIEGRTAVFHHGAQVLRVVVP